MASNSMTLLQIENPEAVTRESCWNSHRRPIAMIALLAVLAMAGPKCIEMAIHGRLVQQSNGLLTSHEVYTIHGLARARLSDAFPDFGLSSVDLQPIAQGQTIQITFRKIQTPILPRFRLTPGYIVYVDKTNQGWRVVDEQAFGGWR